MVKILLVNPKFPIRHPPLGLGYLSSYLKKYLKVPVEIRLFDEVADNSEDILALTGNFRPDLVGISVVTPTFWRAARLCELIRTVTKAPIVAGGVHVTAIPECIMETEIDVGVIGEGEITFLELVEHYLNTGRIADSCISGIVYKEGDFIITTPRRPLITNLDTIPPPDRTIFDMQFYTRPGTTAHGLYAKGTSMMPSRGCPYNKCNFCSSGLMWGNTVRVFSPEYVANEEQSIVEKYGLNFIIFLDDNFTTKLDWLEKLYVILSKRGLTKKVRFDCESIPAFINEKKAVVLKEAGCVRIEFGFESGCARILNILKGGKSSLEINERAIEICRRSGIFTLGNLICGYIDETPGELEESVGWFRRQPIDYVAPHIYTPYPGTAGWNECVTRGLVDPDKVDWERFATGSAKRNLCVNTEFPPGELERKFRLINQEFISDSTGVVIDSGLSVKDRLRLYCKVCQACETTIVRKTGRYPPRAGFFITHAIRLVHTSYRGAVMFLKRSLPKVYHLLRQVRYRMSVVSCSPRCVQNLAGDRDIEWSWIASQMPSGPGEALDFGSGGSHLALIAAQRGFNVTAVDLEPVRWHYVHPKLNLVKGDIFKLSLPAGHFNLVINCSTVEHVGLAGRYSVTENLPDGDLKAMAHLRQLMKPGGIMLLTIPVGQDTVFMPMTRVYGFKRLPLLLKGFRAEREEFWIKNAENSWVQCSRETAIRFKASAGSQDAMRNVYALGCFVLQKESEEVLGSGIVLPYVC